MRILLASILACLPANYTASSLANSAATDAAQAARAASSKAASFENAILISVDGLRADALIAGPPADLPNFQRLRRGASTLNARTDPDWTVTLPNHTAMITGRFVEGEDGHHWTKNDDADPGQTLHSNKQSYVAGIFDVAHDNGFETALFAGKSKFSVYDVSYDEKSGAPDTTGKDDGRDKLDQFVFELDLVKMTDAVIASLAKDTHKGKLYFVHFALPDLTGHVSGWDVTLGSKYMKAAAAVDAQIGRILDAIEASDRLRGKTAIVQTADHGGGAPFRSHDQAHMWVDYIIPFSVWTGSDGEPRDLYAINAGTRREPGISQPRRDDKGLPPIRNGESGNLVLMLLGLPAVPGSTIDAKQDLNVFAPAAR